MADYIYLLERRLSPRQRDAVRAVAELARARNLTVFLVGAAVRDLTSGSPVRDLEIVVQGEVSELRAELEQSGVSISGEVPGGRALLVRFPNGVWAEIGSTVSISYVKPGQPVLQPATILEDLRRRDFTADAMALSLNPGSYGLLMDPLNGVADIENRQLRLVSNYGFIEAPVRLVRAARLMARLGWALEERTEARYRTAKEENYIAALGEFERGFETEEIVHEEDALRVLERLEAEGWMAHLAPFWTAAKANSAELERLHEVARQFEINGVHADPSAASFSLLTARLSAKEIAALKQGFPRRGFVAEIDGLEADAKELASQLMGKGSSTPSQTWKLLHSARPEAVLTLAFSTRSPALQAKFRSFHTEWPQARQKIPYALMQEMRIVPELPGYEDLVERLSFELMDNQLNTPEEMRAFLEPYSPPAPPPPVSARKLRSAKKETKPGKVRAKKLASADDEVDPEPESVSEKDPQPLESAEPVPDAMDTMDTMDTIVRPEPIDPEPVRDEQKMQSVSKVRSGEEASPPPGPSEPRTSSTKEQAARISKVNKAAIPAKRPGGEAPAAKPAALLAPSGKTAAKQAKRSDPKPQVQKKVAAPVKAAPAKSQSPVKTAAKRPAAKQPAPSSSATASRKPLLPAKKTSSSPAKAAKPVKPAKAVKAVKATVPLKRTPAPPQKSASSKAGAKTPVAPVKVPSKAAKTAAPKVPGKKAKAPVKLIATKAGKRRG